VDKSHHYKSISSTNNFYAAPLLFNLAWRIPMASVCHELTSASKSRLHAPPILLLVGKLGHDLVDLGNYVILYMPDLLQGL
jgi:hypothetical protein